MGFETPNQRKCFAQVPFFALSQLELRFEVHCPEVKQNPVYEIWLPPRLCALLYRVRAVVSAALKQETAVSTVSLVEWLKKNKRESVR